MKTISAYRAEDGSIHETREGAARADLVGLGFAEGDAQRMLEARSAIDKVFQQVSGLAYIPAHYPPAVAAMIDAVCETAHPAIEAA